MHPASMPLWLHAGAGAGPDDRLAEAEAADPTTLTVGRGTLRSELAISELAPFFNRFVSDLYYPLAIISPTPERKCHAVVYRFSESLIYRLLQT